MADSIINTNGFKNVSNEINVRVTGVTITAYANDNYHLMSLRIEVPKGITDSTVLANIPNKYIPKQGLTQLAGGNWYHMEDFGKTFAVVVETNTNITFRCTQAATGTWGLTFNIMYLY